MIKFIVGFVITSLCVYLIAGTFASFSEFRNMFDISDWDSAGRFFLSFTGAMFGVFGGWYAASRN